MTDVNLKPLKFYNLTSAYGCYQKSIVDGTVVEGTNPSVLSDGLGIGCTGEWQSIEGVLEYTNYDTTSKLEEAVSYEYGIKERNAVEANFLTGALEQQITVYLLDNANKALSALVSVMVLALAL